jgi:hypothetical protein|tara:strand:+ start:485 stop:703 length:219 start_codon:yes stop_codon:yes gene_type:complete
MSDYKKLEENMIAEVTELKGLCEAGELSESEYNELVEDITDHAKLSAKIGVESDAILVGKVIDAVMLVAKLI